ncbi:MAG: hypothetical protein GY789_24305 [Hyphomicrobiales bacterium]|nr:hypothetical protein [Hyphomicrobiales bacterium]
MSKTIACPGCGSEVPVSPGFQPWCNECGWGCTARAPAAKGVFERIYRRLGHMLGERLFVELRNSEEAIRKPKLASALLLTYVLAVPVYLATVGLLAAGIWFLTVNWFNVIPVVIGTALIGAAYALRPRIAKPPAHGVSRTDAPVLYGLVDDVARSLDTDTIEEIYIEPELNAAYGRHGIQRKAFLVIGAPLWLSLDSAEKVALIAHEVAHQVNGDVTRGYWIGTAIDTLQTACDFLQEPYPDGADLGTLATHYLGMVLSVPVYCCWPHSSI